MGADSTQIYYNDSGKPVMVQMGIEDYEKLVTHAKEAIANKQLIEKTMAMLKG